tara:strand:+ start:159 stop:887 length:729 start_codon:yes stop_codon:yes gene_type:complete
MIQVKNISKSFGGNNVLKNISFNVNRGDSLAIVGKSGAGKSVLLKSLIGLIQIDDGNIIIDDKSIINMSFKEMQKIRSKIGMVFQFGALFDSMNVYDNIAIALEKRNVSKDKKDEIISRYLEEVGMGGTEMLMPSELSGGMRKRVGIARSIAMKPTYLLYDEPTTGLDPVMTDSINRLIKKIIDIENVTSIIVTHEMRTVYNVANRVVLINEGEIAYNGSPENIKKEENNIIRQFVLGDSTI